MRYRRSNPFTHFKQMASFAPKIVNWDDKTEALNLVESPRPTTTSILNWLLPVIKAEAARRWNMSPEMYHVVDDLIMGWANRIVGEKRDVLKEFVEKASLQTCKDLWVLLDAETRGTPCFRRGFATALFDLAKEGELEGWVIGDGYAKFMRQRYNPSHTFACEACAEAKIVAGLPSVCESSSSQESS